MWWMENERERKTFRKLINEWSSDFKLFLFQSQMFETFLVDTNSSFLGEMQEAVFYKFVSDALVYILPHWAKNVLVCAARAFIFSIEIYIWKPTSEFYKLASCLVAFQGIQLTLACCAAEKWPMGSVLGLESTFFSGSVEAVKSMI